MNENTLYSEESCDSITLNTFTQIQPFGVMLVFDKSNLRLLQYSANVEDFLSTPLDVLLKHSISSFLKVSEQAISTWVQQTQKRYISAKWYSPTKIIDIWIYTHLIDDRLILEIELNEEEMPDYQIFELMQKFSDMSFVSFSDDFEIMAADICKEIQKLTDYDRVSLYHFEEGNNGVVLGEAIKNGMESFLGLRFPSFDVPHYVRLMYTKQILRYIPTIDYTPVDLLFAKNAPHHFVDLSHCLLRAVAPVHLQYIRNMGGRAAFSVAIIYSNKLWGLISCQHKTSRYLSPLHRTVLNLFSNTLARRFATLEQNKILQKEAMISQLQNQITNQIVKHSIFASTIKSISNDLLLMLSANGAILYWLDQLVKIGDTPTETQIKTLLDWLYNNYRGQTLATHSLPSLFPESTAYKDIACGILAVPITPEGKNYLIAFRKEIIQTIAWAGDPCKKPKIENLDYSPRASFKKWIQTVQNQSLAWDKMELNAIEHIRSMIANKQLQFLLQEQATHDTLTNLLNRRSLLETLSTELDRAQRNHNPLAIALIDIDYFKQINDDFGHAAGDEILMQFAKFLQKHLRSYDYVFRYGGDEFLLIFPNISPATALDKAEILRKEVNKLVITLEQTVFPAIEISIGLVNFPQHSEDAQGMILLADEALYRAKSQGRNQVVVA